MTKMRLALVSLGLLLAICRAGAQEAPKAPADEPISYFKQIRPIFAIHCQGCHQPAKPLGSYVMTSHGDLLKKGDSGEPAVVPGQPDQSHLLKQITGQNGKPPEMPKGRPQLLERDVAIVAKWIAQGAKDDSPPAAKVVVDGDHPPTYQLPPVITSIDFSPDGRLLAVSGYHEVLLHRADDSGLVARLVGISDRIQSLAFSPDGRQLAVSGGSPGRFGEIQVWNLERKSRPIGPVVDVGVRIPAMLLAAGQPTAPPASHQALLGIPSLASFEIPTDELVKTKLALSVPLTFDTLYGVSWSWDGSKLAFGCGDNTLRAIDAKTGEQVLYQGAHGDWVLATVFSTDSAHLVSVSRDMSMKLTEVATQRFIDNVTSITPGALKGGLQTVALKPQWTPYYVKPSPDDIVKKDKLYDELLIGGSDGVPKIYKMHRSTKRVIGDDANKVRGFEAMPGRIFGVRFNLDGSRFVAGSSLDGIGEARVYETATGKKICTLEGQKGPVYAVAYHPTGRFVATAGFDGVIRLNDPTTGKLLKEFVAVPLAEKTVSSAK